MASPAIELKNVTVKFGTMPLLENISFAVAPGQSLVLIGPSGQGKSVLLKVMAGLLHPSEGNVYIEGNDLYATHGREREALAKKMGMLFQKNALFDSLTCAENVAFPLREVQNAREDAVHQAIDRYLQAVGLSHARDLFPDEISGGMQKRLGIARAIAMKPEIVLYDDPTAGLDPITSRMIVQLILDLKNESGSTVVSVTNDMNRANQLADIIGMVVDREVIWCGSPLETQKSKDPRVIQFIGGLLQGPLTVQA